MAPRGRGRGRGRGAAGRGRGRGAGGVAGRGRGRGGGRGRAANHQRSDPDLDQQMDVEKFDLNSPDAKNIFLSSMSTETHDRCQVQNKYKYLALLTALKMSGAEISLAAKSRALAAAWSRHDNELSEMFLKDRNTFGVVEVLKAVTILDAGRKAREHEKRMAKLKQAAASAGKKGKNRLGRRINDLKKTVNNLTKLKPEKGTLSGAMIRRIKQWTKTIPSEELEFYALHLPKETWTQLADVCHLHPENDFPTLPWFLKSRYDPALAPKDSLAGQCGGINNENVDEFVKNVEIPFAHLKQYSASLSDESKGRVAKYTPDLDTVLWNYEDLACPETDSVVANRLESGEQVKLPYGKFMERLLLMRKRLHASTNSSCSFYPLLIPHAEKMLLDIKVSLESPVVVIGDASASMEVAIETSTIVASFLRALTNAQLVFFSNDVIEPPFLPTTIEQVLQLATTVKTVASTCHAAALWPYYKRKQVVKTFIITTDEEENTNYNGDGHSYRFLELFKKYHDEVYPSRLVFVSFLNSQHARGQMVEPLKAAGYDVMQFKLDHHRPDLTKLNALVGQLAMNNADDFDKQVDDLEKELRTNGLQGAFEKLNSKLQS